MTDSPDKPWGGRFGSATAELMERFNASIGFDRKLLEVDVAASVVYARALARASLLTPAECEQVVSGLKRVRAEMAVHGGDLEPRLEDIHMAVEERLTSLIGPLAGKLHTGRSRNDQVNVDERLYLRGAVDGIDGRIARLQQALVTTAGDSETVVLPGYTHLQQAQPILFSHYALSLFWMLDRDRGRLRDAAARADVLPLGSGALAGSAFRLDREFMARELGFSRVSENSIDAVSDRDFLLEALAALAILMMHLSRFCEDLVIWSSAEFGFVELDEAYATGSSMMPQKKNPDSLELIRGKTGRVYGNLLALLATLKGLALTYSKDLQEDKEPLFDSFETAADCLEVFAAAWSTMKIHSGRMEAAVDDATLATDLADYLVGKGVPFRGAHRIVGGVVREALAAGGGLRGLGLEALQVHSEAFGEDALEVLDLRRSLARRNIRGGTGPDAVAEQLEAAWARLARTDPV